MNINTKKLTLQYCILQGAYWASFCIIYSFATVFLLDRGFHNSQIGVIIAAGNILGVIFQPVFASVVDRSKTVTLHKLTNSLYLSGIITAATDHTAPKVEESSSRIADA